VKILEVVGAVVAVLLVVLVALFFPGVPPASAAGPEITLEWTAPGDDGNVGTASRYEMRMSTAVPDTSSQASFDSWWASASVVPGVPSPVIAGTTQSVTISNGLNYSTTYYFAMIACDDGLPASGPIPIENCSARSNIASKDTGPAPDITAPARIVDLIAR
jgi:hypothetical protein